MDASISARRCRLVGPSISPAEKNKASDWLPRGQTVNMNNDNRFLTEHSYLPPAGLVNGITPLNGLSGEVLDTEDMDYSARVPSTQILVGDVDRQFMVAHGQWPPVAIFSDHVMLDDPLQEDFNLDEKDYSTFRPSQPIPCYTKKEEFASRWVDDEAYFSYNTVEEENGWLATEDLEYSSYNGRPSMERTRVSSCPPAFPKEVSILCIDPRLTSLPTESALSAMIAEERQSQSGVVTVFPSQDLQLKENILAPNDFDRLLAETTTLPVIPTTPAIDEAGIGWLDQWLKCNSSRLPSSNELQCLEGLTSLPGAFILDWLLQRSTNLPGGECTEPSTTRVLPSTKPSAAHAINRNSLSPKSTPPSLPSSCSSRPCPPPRSQPDPSSPHRFPHPNSPLYHCTTPSCPATFTRRSDWARHERKRFETWLCPLPSCGASLTRKEKLRDHLRVVHGRMVVGALGRQLEGCRREKDGEDAVKTCGFCGEDFAEWRDWLGHVGDHFEGRTLGS